MRRLLVPLLMGVALLIGSGISADTGALPAPPPPPSTDTFFALPGAHLLQVDVEPWGAGYVRSVDPADVLLLAPYYLDCPMACIRPIDRGSSFVLLAFPTPGFTFAGWRVANHGQPQLPAVCPGLGPCLLSNITQSMDVVADFTGFYPGADDFAPPPTPPCTFECCEDCG
jgi:hypothetical protein